MKWPDHDLIASYRTIGPCSWCGRRVMLCAAHVFSKGAGGPDIPCNLVALGADAVLGCTCHHDSHLGQRPIHADLLAIAASQNDCSQDDIESVVWFVRRLPKGTTLERIAERIEAELTPTARTLARRDLLGMSY